MFIYEAYVQAYIGVCIQRPALEVKLLQLSSSFYSTGSVPSSLRLNGFFPLKLIYD